MAGFDDEDLSMDMIQLDTQSLQELSSLTQDNEQLNSADDSQKESQEGVGTKTEDTSSAKTTGETTKSPANSDENVLKLFAGFLSERGLLSVEKEELEQINDEDAFAELMKKQIKQNEFAQLNDTQKKYLEALENGIPTETFLGYAQASQAYEQLTDEVIQNNVGVQRDLIVEGYMAKGFSREYALKQFQRVSDAGESVEEAKMFKETLKQIQDQRYQSQIEEQTKLRQEQENLRKQQIEDLKKSVYSKSKLFEGFDISKGVQDKVYDLMTREAGRTPDGIPVNALLKDQMENPVEFQTNLYYVYELTNGFKDLSKLGKKATTKATQEFKSKLEKASFIGSSTTNPYIENEGGETPIITDVLD